MELTVWGQGDVTWDDVFFAADLPRPYDPDAVLTKKLTLDEQTVVLVDFDSPGTYRLEGGAKLTDEGGGRFGKGLRLERALVSSAVIPLTLERMPEEGTLEFWFAPDGVPDHIHCFSVLQAGDLDLLKFQADTSDSLRLSWRTSAGLYDPQPSLACGAWQSRDWFRPGQWQHLAVQWNPQVVRYYVNGVLVDYSTERPLPFFQTPASIKLGALYSVYAWSGLIDEVRLSRVQRYGPFVPVGGKWTDFAVAAEPRGAEKQAAPAKLLPPPDYASLRTKLIGKLPASPAGAVTLDAAELRPLVQGAADFRLERDSPAPGMTTAWIGHEGRLIRDPDNDGAYWKLAAVTPGRYYVGVWYESGKAGAEAPQHRFGALCLYLNGRLLQLSTASDPVQVAPGVYFAEAQTGAAADLRPGDEIAVLPESIRRMRITRLTLYPTEPVRGHGWIPENYGATWFSRDTALRLNLDATFGGRATDGFRQDEALNLPADLPLSGRDASSSGLRRQGVGTESQPTGQALVGTESQPTGQALVGTESQPTGQALVGTESQPTGQALVGMESQPTGQALVGTESQPTGQALVGTESQPTGQALVGTESQPTGQALVGMESQPTGQALVGTESQPTGQALVGMESQPTGQALVGMESQPTGRRAMATCRISNPLAVPLTVEYEAEIRAYFRELVGEDRATLTLQPHERVTREIPFEVLPDSRRYSLAAQARVRQPPALGWPATDTIQFFPGVSQDLPWPDPFTAKEERAITFTGTLPGPRTRCALNGAWQVATTTSLSPPVPPPPELDWKSRQVPFASWQYRTENLNPRPHGLYLRRTLNLPEKEAQRSYRLTIKEVLDEGTVYVNGQQVGNVRGGETPLTCDITAAVRAGDNDVLIVLRDVLAIMDPDYVNPASPTMSVAYLDAPGGGSMSGWGIGQVALESSPPVAAYDLLVLPSVRRHELTARLVVTSHESAAVKLRVVARVLDAGRPVLELGQRELLVQPGQTAPLTWTQAWQDPVLWGPQNPKLYTLAVETLDAATGQRLDLLRERFGFRECWVDKDRLYFNGAPVRLKGSTCQGGGGVNIGDVQWSRGAPYPDFMDEFGYLVSVPLAAIFNSSSRHNVDHDQFWESARRNVLAGAAWSGNHPCIIAWDLSNEWLSFLDYGGGDPQKGARRFQTLDRALKAFDPSRWTFFNGDEDLHGLHDTFSTHYMLESANPHPVSGFGFRGHSNYFPDGAFFRPLDQAFQPGQEIAVNTYRGTRWRYGEKVLMNTENLWKVSAYMPPGLSKFASEDDVLGPGIDSGRGPIAWMWKQNLDGHRDLGVSAVCNYTPVAGVARRGHGLQCFIMPDHTHHAYSGGQVRRSYSLHNDLFIPGDFVFQWDLLEASGQAVAHGEERRRMASGDLQRGAFSLVAPQVTQRTRFTLRMQVLANGSFVYGEHRDLDVWPQARVPVATPHRSLVLFDPVGATAAVFQKARVAYTAINELTAPEGDPDKTLLVVGEGALQADTAVVTGKLNAYVAAGGRLVVLAQDRALPGLPVRTALEPKEWVSLPFVRTPQHPVLAGLTSWDLQFWNPDHVSARGAYAKPDSGAVVTLVDSGTDTGLEWVQMLECYRGRGFYLLNQFPVIRQDDVEPMARELWQRLLTYAAGEKPFRAPAGQLLVSADPDSPVLPKLRHLGVSCAAMNAASPVPETAVLLLDAGSLSATFQPPAHWARALRSGATVLVHGARPEHREWLSALAGQPLGLAVQPWGMWEGRAYRNGCGGLLPGLSQIDLYWKRYDGSEGAGAQADDPSLKIEDPLHYAVAAEGACEHVFPGGLVEIPVGQGRLLVDQLRWETPQPKLERLSNRVVSALMLGLGVAIAPYTPSRELPREIAYQPQDLTSLANRGLADQQGDDGQGGWSDQGPDLDLRNFPTGRQHFGGVPFVIGAEPRCCLVLKSDARPFPDRLPADVPIPVGLRLEGLSFLHAATFAGSGQQVGLYQIEYADETVQEIKLVADENIRDWVSPPALLPREKGTQSRIAWTGTTKVFPVTSVFQMLWVNPRPDVPVRAVRFANPQRVACPILIALTAVVRDEQAVADRKAAQARAQQLLDQGLAASGAGQDTQARDLLQQALTADPSRVAAYQALGATYEKLKDEDGVLATYRAWIKAGAKTPLPYNRVGQILEQRKDDRGALEAYVRSLQIEWNQPPIIEARRRLEKRLAN